LCKTYRPLPSSSFVQCCSQVVVTGFEEPTGTVVVDVVFVVSFQLKEEEKKRDFIYKNIH